jgi:hypothetical protein
VIEREYARYEFASIEDGIRWDVEAVRSWTDIHWRGTVPEGTGVGLDLKVEGPRERLRIVAVIKDANMAEFAAPTLAVAEDGWHAYEWPLAAFRNAPWAAVRPPKPALPIKGFKLVLRGTGTGQPFVVGMRRLRSLRGTVVEETTVTFGAGMFGPMLVPERGAGRVIGHIADRPELPALVAAGKGPDTVIYCAVPHLTGTLLQGLVREVGVHRYLHPPGDVLRTDSRFIQLHTRSGGVRNLSLPGEWRVRDAVTGRQMGTGRALQLRLPPNSTTALEVSRPE